MHKKINFLLYYTNSVIKKRILIVTQITLLSVLICTIIIFLTIETGGKIIRQSVPKPLPKLEERLLR